MATLDPRPSPTIDAHQHFWIYDPREYGWIKEDMAALRCDFLPDDLVAAMRTAQVDAVVCVQARQSLIETEWLLGLALQHGFIAGVVGWVPLAAATAREELVRLSAHAKLKAVRHVLQDEADPYYMLRPDFNRGVRLLRELRLAYDILIFERHLPQTITFVDQHPDQVFILDHVAKPRIREGLLDPWRTHLRELARRDNVCCKLSGMVTEADPLAWTMDQLRPYVESALEAFGPARLMLGSDWPVCLLGCTYVQWLDTVRELLAELTASEREAIMGATARRAYRLDEPGA